MQHHRRIDLCPSIWQALELAREQGDSIKDQIWRELARAK
jgi:hypothetical protein